MTMTTHVPDRTPAGAVDDIRAREATRARELAADGHLLRLWRPPLQPGEWRSLGLFAADDDQELEKALASMPLRVWRTAGVTPLGPHPHDPRAVSTAATRAQPEFFTTLTVTVPTGTPPEAVEETQAREYSRARELAAQGHLQRLWRLPTLQGLGLWRAADAAALEAILTALPLAPWLTVETTPLSAHPSDPGILGQ